jgi:hypothetical protein
MTEMANEKASAFWQWFENNHHQYLFINDIQDEDEKERVLDLFLTQLHLYNPELFFEVGGFRNSEFMDLFITAQGIVAQFPSVEFLLAEAPKMKDWNFVAFKPAMGTNFTTTIGGKIFDPKNIIFIPLESEDDPDWLGIEVCYPDFEEEEKNEFILGTYLILDVLLGEKSAALDIDFLDVVITPDDLNDFPFFHLSEIKSYIDGSKAMQ